MPHPTRPDAMRIDERRCVACELCYRTAPIIRADAQRIPVAPDTLDAMAECPTGAIVWIEAAPSTRSLSDR